jgi:hypothetical protein
LIPAELESSAETLAIDLAGWTEDRFFMAIQEHRRRSNYLPMTHSLILADAAVRSAVAEPIPLPPGKDEMQEIWALGKRRVRELLDNLAAGCRRETVR